MVLTREKQNKALQDFVQRQENNAQTRSSLSVDTDWLQAKEPSRGAILSQFNCLYAYRATTQPKLFFLEILLDDICTKEFELI